MFNSWTAGSNVFPWNHFFKFGNCYGSHTLLTHGTCGCWMLTITHFILVKIERCSNVSIQWSWAAAQQSRYSFSLTQAEADVSCFIFTGRPIKQHNDLELLIDKIKRVTSHPDFPFSSKYVLFLNYAKPPEGHKGWHKPRQALSKDFYQVCAQWPPSTVSDYKQQLLFNYRIEP